MVDERPAPPRPWEQKAAIGCLVILSMQAAYEGFRYVTGDVFPRSGKVLVVGLFGGLLTAHTWGMIRSFFR